MSTSTTAVVALAVAEKFPSRTGPKSSVVEGMEPGSIAGFSLNARAAGIAGVGSAFAPVTQHLAQRYVYR